MALDTLHPVVTSDPVNRQHPLAHGLLAWWLAVPGLDGGKYYYDLMHRKHGELLTGTTWRTTARQGGFGELSFSTSGGSDRVEVANYDQFNITTTMTVSVWFRSPTAQNGALVSVWTHLEKAFTIYLGQDAANSKVAFGVSSGGAGFNGSIMSATADYTANHWTHTALVADGTNIVGYVNGLSVGSSAFSSALYSVAGQTLVFGSLYKTGDGTYGFDGQLDDVRLYNRGLSASEVCSLYHNSKLGYPNLLNRRKSKVHYLLSASTASFEYEATGELRFSNAATASLSLTSEASGGLRLSGTAEVSVSLLSEASGELRLSGTATTSLTLLSEASGELRFSNAATASLTLLSEASGELRFSNAATASLTLLSEASGGLRLSNTAEVSVTYFYAASGGLRLSNSATASIVTTASLGGVIKILDNGRQFNFKRGRTIKLRDWGREWRVAK